MLIKPTIGILNTIKSSIDMRHSEFYNCGLLKPLTILFLTILSPLIAVAQPVYLQYNFGGYTAFNKLASDKSTNAEINNYYRLKPVTGAFISLGLGVKITDQQTLMLSRKSIDYGVRGEFKGGFSDRLGGGLFILDRHRAEWNLLYSHELIKKKNVTLTLNPGVNFLNRKTGWIPQIGAGYIGSDSNRYWVDVTDSDSFYLKSFRLVTGCDFSYKFNKHWNMGLNFSYQFGGKPIFDRSVKIIDSRLNEPLEFSEICNGRSVFFSVLVRYTPNPN